MAGITSLNLNSERSQNSGQAIARVVTRDDREADIGILLVSQDFTKGKNLPSSNNTSTFRGETPTPQLTVHNKDDNTDLQRHEDDHLMYTVNCPDEESPVSVMKDTKLMMSF